MFSKPSLPSLPKVPSAPSAPSAPAPPGAPPPPPALSAQFQSTVQPPQPGAAPQTHGWSLLRSSDGKTRMDQGSQSLITDPKAGQSILLDHNKQEAQIFPMPSTPSKPAAPSGSAPSLTPPNAPVNVTDLGKRMIGEHEVEGKSYTYQVPQMPGAPKAPSAPQTPQMPGAPQIPGLPKPPQAGSPPSAPGAPAPPSTPGAPALPQAPKMQTLEVWTSPKLQLPMASRLTGDMGKQTTVTKQVTPGEPPAASFQIPPGYKIIPPPHAPTASS